MLLREEFESREDTLLAPYALRSKLSKGRQYKEIQHEFRPAFQRDKERISYSTAFRRLEYKTQVFVNHEGDHYRTRLTHTLEVSLISRSIARSLCLNEDLVEAIALAHDLGHSPFGHAGEKALDELMKEEGGFEHNLQSLRMVEILEDCYENFPGLNLTWEVREGLKKHAKDRMNAFEYQMVDIADEIAYNAHDLNDGLRSNYLTLDQVKELSIWKRLELDDKNLTSANKYLANAKATRNLVNSQVIDIIENTTKNIHNSNIENLYDVMSCDHNIVCFSKIFADEVFELRRFLFENLYQHPKVKKMSDRGHETINTLFHIYEKVPHEMPRYFQQKMPEWGNKRVICDYIAGMTDRYADKELEKLKKSS
ncbi:deoxyguanosinetriphosphate triphosphohydrolase [Candidatus Omnitrophota bacterium]